MGCALEALNASAITFADRMPTNHETTTDTVDRTDPPAATHARVGAGRLIR